MDSLTQIVLGAACGELAVGKKIGNKAMLLGAIGGTIPDLDVIIGSVIFNDEIQKLAFHRGFMHSILFAVIATIVLAYFSDVLSKKSSMRFKDWSLLWFWSIFTHPLLDAFTAYGTQLFLPFSSYRVALNTISVVDVFYTIPFLICLLIVLFITREKLLRRIIIGVGLGYSILYLIGTFFTKNHVNNKIEEALKEQEINYIRYQNQPVLFTNILWYGIVESKNYYYTTNYSLLDMQSITFKKYNKNKTLLDKYKHSENWKTLEWFTNSYYNLIPISKDTIRLDYVAYPESGISSNPFIFNFNIVKKQNDIEMLRFNPSKRFREDKEPLNVLKKEWNRILTRIKGN